MGFEVVEVRVAPQDEAPQLFVELKKKKNSRRPAFRLSIKKKLGANLGWSSGDGVSVWVGSGEDAGKLQLAAGTAAFHICKLRSMGAGGNGGFYLDLGFLSSFGLDARVRAAADAECKNGTLIVTVPGGVDWVNQWAIEANDAVAPVRAAPPSPQPPPEDLPSISAARRVLNDARKPEPPRAAGPDVLKPLAKKAATLAQRFAMKVNRDPFEIVNAAENGGKYPCTEIQAGIAATLLAVSPSLLLPDQLAARAYAAVGRKMTSGTPGLIDYEVRVLQPRLVDIGIKITHTKGMGYSLAAIDPS